MLVGDWVQNEDRISVKEEKLNLLERLYSVMNYDSFTAEIFGKRSKKVDASGYSFPVSFC